MVSIVPHKIKISLLRDAEVLAIKESLGRVVSCSVSRDRCIIDSPQRQQKIIISLESGYPAIPGPRGLRVVACYPYFKPYSDEDTTRAVATWQELITSKNIKSLSEFIEKCINADLARLNI